MCDLAVLEKGLIKMKQGSIKMYNLLDGFRIGTIGRRFGLTGRKEGRNGPTGLKPPGLGVVGVGGRT